MRHTLFKTAIVLGTAAFGALAFRDGANPTHYSRLFPAPMGNNGYEEFALAADLSNSSKLWQVCEHSDNVSIEYKRQILADPLIQHALAAVRAGLKKPVIYPHSGEEMTTLLPEMRDFRSVGRILKVEMEVRFTDGQPSRALDSLDDGLSFGRGVQVGGITSGAVGLLVENTMLHALAEHLGDLTIRDCDKLEKIAKAHFALPDIQSSIIPMERDIYARTFTNHRSNVLDLLNKLELGPNALVSERDDFAEVRALLRRNPDFGTELLDKAAETVRRHYDATLGELQRPVWDRNYPIATDRDSPASKLLFAFCPRSYTSISDRFISERALLQVIAAHASVIRYRILHKRFPINLQELHLGNLGTDVFTGEPLKFTSLRRDAYEISSSGPWDHGNGNTPPSGKRTPITVKYPNSD